MDYFFNNPDWKNDIFWFARRSRTSYIKATILVLIERILKFALTLLCIIEVIAFLKGVELNTVYCILTIALLFAVRIIEAAHESNYYAIPTEEQCKTKEYFQIQEKIISLIDDPQTLKMLNPRLDRRSFTLFKMAGDYNGYTVIYKAFRQKFTLYIITDSICCKYIDMVSEPEDPQYTLSIDLNLEELKCHDIIVRFFETEKQAVDSKNDTIAQIRKSIKNQRPFLDYCVIKIIDRNPLEFLG